MSDGSTVSIAGDGDEALSSDIFSGHGDISEIHIFNDDGTENQVVSEFVSDINNTVLLQDIDLNKLMELAGLVVVENGSSGLLLPEHESVFPELSLPEEVNVSNKTVNQTLNLESYVVTPDEDFFMTESVMDASRSSEVQGIVLSADDSIWDREGFLDYELQHDTIWVNPHIVDDFEPSLIL